MRYEVKFCMTAASRPLSPSLSVLITRNCTGNLYQNFKAIGANLLSECCNGVFNMEKAGQVPF